MAQVGHTTARTLSLLLHGPLPLPHVLEIHARAIRAGADGDNLVATRLIGRLPPRLAIRLLRRLPRANLLPFNAALRVLSESTHPESTHPLSVLNALKRLSLSPNDFTFSFLLKALIRSAVPSHALQIHSHLTKSGLDRHPLVLNSLIAAFAKGIKDLGHAHKLFDEIPQRELVLPWTLLISGYAHLGQHDSALRLFSQMVGESLMPDDETMVGVLSACSNLTPPDIERWEKFFSEFRQSCHLGHLCDCISTVLVYLYGKRGEIKDCRKVFDEMSERSVLSWNAMIGGYVQNGYPVEALDLFRIMITGPNSRPNHVTMVGVLSACAQVGDLDLGRWVHEYMRVNGRKGILESNSFLATALIDMYCKCGCLERSKEVFDRMVTKDVVSFNAMINGLATNGEGQRSLQLFYKMKEFGVCPNDGTFLAALCACTHSRLVAQGRVLFENMQKFYSVTPKIEHYACYIDLLARAGHVEEALETITTMPVEPNGLVWGALLGACLIHSKGDLASYVAKRLVNVDPTNPAGYVMLSNAYALDQQWNEIYELRRLMKIKRVKKQSGSSWISVDGVVYEFLVGLASHPQIQSIHDVLDGLSKELRLIDRYTSQIDE